jgi:hypothetical protein
MPEAVTWLLLLHGQPVLNLMSFGARPDQARLAP